jgi:hypothetical protein
MKFLTAGEVKSWFEDSLAQSGVAELTPDELTLWKHLISRGNNALPPGFLRHLVRRLLETGSGILSLDPRENLLLETLSSDAGFVHLRGRLVFTSPDKRSSLLISALERLCEKIGGFTHPDIHFHEAELRGALAAGTISEPDFPGRLIRDQLYTQLLSGLQDHRFRLQRADLFEILNHDLFPTPAAKTLYRRLMESFELMNATICSQLSLPEESSDIIARFGEPDILPLGGFDSLTTRGDFPSLLPSELAYIDSESSLDLFDYKFLENQLLYFKREEGSVFRIKRRFVLTFQLREMMEHERHLAVLFAFVLVTALKLQQTFIKDIIHIRVRLLGFQPTHFEPALGFLRHFIEHQKLNAVMSIHTAVQNETDADEESRFQHWLIGPTETEPGNFVPFEYPQNGEFACLTLREQCHILADAGNTVLEAIGRFSIAGLHQQGRLGNSPTVVPTNTSFRAGDEP